MLITPLTRLRHCTLSVAVQVRGKRNSCYPRSQVGLVISLGSKIEPSQPCLSLVTNPRIGFRHLCDIYARRPRFHSSSIALRSDHVLVHLVPIETQQTLAKVVVTRRCQNCGLIAVEPSCSALIASAVFLYSYVSMLQREESPGGLSTSLKPTLQLAPPQDCQLI